MPFSVTCIAAFAINVSSVKMALPLADENVHCSNCLSLNISHASQ